jgi:hypothetical protein
MRISTLAEMLRVAPAGTINNVPVLSSACSLSI